MSTPSAPAGSRRPLLLSLLLASILTLSSVSVAFAVTPEEDPAAAAAAFLAASYEDHPESFGFGVGSLPDLVFALAGAGAGASTGEQALTQLEAGADAYLTTSGAVAKVLLAVQVAGDDASDFAGRDLEQELRAAMAEDGSFHPYAVNQTYAVLALAGTTDGVPAEALDWLDSQQCEDGSVGNDFEETGEAQCPGDSDTTALAAQAFAAAGRDVDAGEAIAWLLANQADDGSFSNFGANANSTGLAAQALRAAGETAAADLAAAWVAAQQVPCDGGELAGAIRSPYEGAPSTEFATLQGILAFGAPRLDALDLTTAEADAPTLTCASAPTPEPEPGDEATAEPGDGETAEPAPEVDEAEDEDTLPATGTQQLWLVSLAAALILLGSRAVVLGRRDG